MQSKYIVYAAAAALKLDIFCGISANHCEMYHVITCDAAALTEGNARGYIIEQVNFLTFSAGFKNILSI